MKVLFFYVFTIVAAVYGLLFPNAAAKTSAEATASADNAAAVSPTATVSASHTRPAAVPEVESASSAPAAAVVPTEVPFDDPIAEFGDPKVQETFEQGSTGFGLGAGLNDEDYIRYIATNNKVTIEPKMNNGWLSWRLRPPVITDGAAEMDISFTTCARGDRTGILMRSENYTDGKGYYFSLACEGTLSIYRDTTLLNSMDVSDVFKNGSGDVNHLEAIVKGDKLTAVLNDAAVLSVEDNTYTEGFCGFFTAPQGQNTLTMSISAFNLYYNEN